MKSRLGAVSNLRWCLNLMRKRLKFFSLCLNVLGDKPYIEFARDLVTHFSRWCSASDVKDFDDLCNLVLEQFKNSVPERIAVHISEQKVKTAVVAAALADDYFLTHAGSGGDPRMYAFAGGRENGPAGGMYFSGCSVGSFFRSRELIVVSVSSKQFVTSAIKKVIGKKLRCAQVAEQVQGSACEASCISCANFQVIYC